MATEAIPKFVGMVTISTVNNTFAFWESSVSDSSVTLDDGDYWPDELAAHLETKLNAVVTGWTCSVGASTGLLTISRSSGTWYPKNTTSQTNKAGSGGDTNVDTEQALAAGEKAPNHMGFLVDSTTPSNALSHTADIPMSGSWYPTEPPAVYEPFYSKVVKVSESVSGVLYHADYTGTGKGRDGYRFEFQYQEEADRLLLTYDWWKWYASAGGIVRYYPDRSASDYLSMQLAAENCESEPFSRQQMGFNWFRGAFSMRIVYGA